MPVYSLGALNTSALTAPDVYVQKIPPRTRYINGVPTDILGIVGVGSWGPVNSAVFASADTFGPVTVRKYDLASAIAISAQIGANNIRGVRVTDGTDAAASTTLMDAGVAATGSIAFTTNPAASSTITLNGTAVTFVASGATGNQVNIGAALSNTLTALLAFLQASADVNLIKFTYALNGTTLDLTAAATGTAGNALTVATTVTGATPSGANLTGGVAPATGATLTAFYTGTVGNTLSATIAAGTAPNTFRLSISRPGYAPETFDNIAGSGGTFWANLANAVNNGQTGLRGPSQLAVATAGSSTAAPSLSTYAFAGGLDGATSVTDTSLIGADGLTPSLRKGMYALRGSGAQALNVIDMTTSTLWPSIVAFCNGEGIYAPGQGAAGASYSTVAAALVSAGVDDPSLKVMVGDWIIWQDTTNGVTRLMAPATFEAAEVVVQPPHQSTLNKAIPGIAGTQRTSQNQPYSTAEIGAIAASRLDVITNPCPGGAYFGCRTGRNASSDPTRNGDNYTRLTNYLAMTLAASYGWVVGNPQTADLRQDAKASMVAFLANLQRQGMIGDPNGGPAFSVTLDASNNPDSQVALGYMQADVQVKYLGIVWFFLVNLEGGQTVNVQLVGAKAA